MKRQAWLYLQSLPIKNKKCFLYFHTGPPIHTDGSPPLQWGTTFLTRWHWLSKTGSPSLLALDPTSDVLRLSYVTSRSESAAERTWFFGKYFVHTNWKDDLRGDGMSKKLQGYFSKRKLISNLNSKTHNFCNLSSKNFTFYLLTLFFCALFRKLRSQINSKKFLKFSTLEAWSKFCVIFS